MRAQLIRNGTSSPAIWLRGFWDTPPRRYHLPRMDVLQVMKLSCVTPSSDWQCLTNVSATLDNSQLILFSFLRDNRHKKPHEAGSRLNDRPQTSSIWMWSRSYAMPKSLIALSVSSFPHSCDTITDQYSALVSESPRNPIGSRRILSRAPRRVERKRKISKSFSYKIYRRRRSSIHNRFSPCAR